MTTVTAALPLCHTGALEAILPSRVFWMTSYKSLFRRGSSTWKGPFSCHSCNITNTRQFFFSQLISSLYVALTNS